MRAAIYCRISDDRTGEAAGVGRQEADARALCERRGWDVVDVITDNDLAASRYSRKIRPGYQRLLDMATTGTIDVIAAYHVDRLYRRPAELEVLIDLAETVLIGTCEGEFRLDTSDGRAMARVIAAMAAKASDDASRRLRRKHLALAEEGKVGGGGRRPFGFDDDRVTIRETEAIRVREAAARIIAGDSLSTIVRSWNAEGVTTVTGGRWETTALRRIVEAPRVAGLRSLKGRVVGDAVWPAILDRTTWEACKAALAAPRRTMEPRIAARSYLLSGLLVCECGTAMSAAPTFARGHRYRRHRCLPIRGGCGSGISADRAEETVVDGLLRRATRTGDITPPAPLDLMDEATGRILAAEAELAELADDLDHERIGVASFRAAAAGIEARIDRIRGEMAAAGPQAVLDDLATAADPAAVWDALPWDRKRLALVRRIDRITVARSTEGATGFDAARLYITWRTA